MAKSLLKHCPETRLFILCFDDLSFEIVEKLKMPGIIPVALSSFEDEELKRVKSGRTRGEYYWTCTPSLPLFLFNQHPEIDMITYLDADLMFFSSPEPLLKEMGTSSVLITPHRYTPRYDASDTSGIYCVQFVSFKRNDEGFKVLNWWREKCLDWCFSYYEEGKFGDQKYLDDWPVRFKDVYVCNHIGGGAAPWNIQQYRVTESGNQVYVNDFPLIFYHYHSLKVYEDFEIYLGYYPIAPIAVKYIYKPYRKAILECYQQVNEIHAFSCGFEKRPPYLRKMLHYLKLRFYGGVPTLARPI